MTEPIHTPRLRAAMDQLDATLEPFGETVALFDGPFGEYTDSLDGLHRAVLGGAGPGAVRALFDQVEAGADTLTRAAELLAVRIDEHTDALAELHRALFGDPEDRTGRVMEDAGGPEAVVGVYCDALEAALRDDEQAEAARGIAYQRLAGLGVDEASHRVMWQMMAMTVTRRWAEELGWTVPEVVALVRKP